MMKKYSILIVALIAFSAVGYPLSPWENEQTEINPVTNGILPNVICNWFDREREQWNYNPRFMPGMITFHPSGYIFMRVGVPDFCTVGANGLTYPSRFWTQNAYMQFKTETSTWREIPDFIPAIRTFLNLAVDDELYIQAGERVSDAVECGSGIDVMTLCNTMYIKSGQTYYKNLILYSAGNLHDWQVKELDGVDLRIAPYRVHADHNALPVVTSRSNGIMLYIPKLINGVFDVSTAINLVPSSAHTVVHSVMAGAGARCITTGGKTFVVYASSDEEPGYTGTPHYIVEYDHSTDTITGPVFLGTTGESIDGHNTPVIDVDSNGYLHVIGGAHWQAFKHWVSSAPRTITGNWSMTYIEGNGDNRWSRDGLTYPGFVIDKKDILHLICRGRNSYFSANDPTDPWIKGYPYGGWLDYALIYLRKKPGQAWEARKDIATPQWKDYSNWYHKIGINRDGSNVFVTYYYYASWLSGDAQDAYELKWGSELPGGVYSDADSRAHDPVLAITSDNGDTWRVAKTSDIVDLRLLLTLDENSGATAATDDSGNGNDGVLTNMDPQNDWIAGRIGNALDFDGINDYLNCGNDPLLQLTGDITLAFWIKPSNIGAHRINLLDKSYSGEFTLVVETDGALSYYHHRTVSPYYWSAYKVASIPIQNGTWQHIALTRDTNARRIQVYYNGILKATVVYPSDALPAASSNPLKFGNGYAGAFEGQMDDIRIYTKVQDQAFIEGLVN
jgi:hypothetical protein